MTASPNNVIITYPHTGTVTRRVTIATTRIEQIWNKALTLITYPKSDKDKDIDEGANTTKIIDLLMKAEKRWSIDGFIHTGVGSASPEDIDASAKLADMKEIFFVGKTFNINIEGTDYQVNSDKFNSTWVVDDKSTVETYSIKFTVVEGEELNA